MPSPATALTPRSQPAAPVDLSTLVKDVSGLVSPPHVCVRVFELMRSTDTSARDFGELISQDPNLTARLLRIANSSFYGFSSRIDTVSRAVAVLGMNELYNLAIAVSALKSFSEIPSSLVSMETFWRHSVYCGLVARALAKRCRILHPERLFVAGLLHDIGSLVLFNRLPELCGDLLAETDGDEEALHRAEIDALGFSHAEVGSVLLTTWNLPPVLPGAVRGHHDPSKTVVGHLEACIVRIANLLANQSENGALQDPRCAASIVSTQDWQRVGLSADKVDVPALVASAEAELSQTTTLLAADA